MEADSGIRLAALKVDGGACANNYLMQTQAGYYQRAGAAPPLCGDYRHGRGVSGGACGGVLGKQGRRGEKLAIDRTFAPNIGAEEREKRIRGWNKALKCAYGWAKD